MSPRLCVLTPSGRGAVAVIAVEGPEAVTIVGRFFQAANKRELVEQPMERIVYGHWGGPAIKKTNGKITKGEDLIVCRRSEHLLEIHCHGGRQSSAQLVDDLANLGCKVIEGNQWLTSQQDCPLTAAAHLALAQATTVRSASILLAQYQGALRREIESAVTELTDEDSSKAVARLEQLLRFAEFGRHLTEPWQVVIAGQPNVGKSSLINALVGYQRAIVFDQPGTTRDVVSSATAIDGWPVELSDTAGLHQTTDSIETAGMALARERLRVADLVVWVLDAVTVSTSAEDIGKLAQQQAQAAGLSLERQQSLLVINKIDLADFAADDPFRVGTCAVTGQGIEQLLAAIAARLVPEVPPPCEAVPFATKQVEALQAALSAAVSNQCTAAKETLHQLMAIAPGSAGE